MTTADELRAADDYCRLLTARHYENFSVASRVAPARVRQHLARIYAYCRTTDDLGDESGSHATSRLEWWRDEVARSFTRPEDPTHPVLLALRATTQAFSIPAAPFIDLIDANLQDQSVTEYEDWAELAEYCTLSAAPVGRMVLAVFEANSPVTERLSDDVCIGLQLANFAQDVSVDRGKGRTYIPQSELRAHGMPGAVARTCDRAEALLASGRELESMVPPALRAQLALYRLGGLAIIEAIRRVRHDTEHVRPTVSRSTKIRLLPVALLASAGRRVNASPHRLA